MTYDTATRRAERLAENGGSHSKFEWRTVLASQGYQCNACAADLHMTGAERDHIIPVAAGGCDSIGNIQALCPRCNRSKSKMAWDEFLWRSGNVGLERLRADAEANKSQADKVGDFVLGALVGMVALVGLAAIVVFMFVGKRRLVGAILGGVGIGGIGLGLTQFVGANNHRWAGVVTGVILSVLGAIAWHGIDQAQRQAAGAAIVADYGLHALTPGMTRQQLVDELNATEDVDTRQRQIAAAAKGCTYHGCLLSYGDEPIVDAHRFEIEGALAASAPAAPKCHPDALPGYRGMDFVNGPGGDYVGGRWVLCQ